jgi:hypothetical protein
MLVTVATAALFAVAQSAAPTAIPDTAAGNRPWERGDRYLYQRFFAHVNSINQRADDAERQGMNSYYLRNYIQKTALLYPSQVAVLNQVAAELATLLFPHRTRQPSTCWQAILLLAVPPVSAARSVST